MKHARNDYNRIQDPLTPGTPLNTILTELTGPAPVLYFSTSEGQERKLCVFCRAEVAVAKADEVQEPMPHTGQCVVRAAEDLLASKGNPIPADEPVFLLRGQDRLAAGVVWAWATDCCAALGPDSDIVRAADRQGRAMQAWPVKKQADL